MTNASREPFECEDATLLGNMGYNKEKVVMGRKAVKEETGVKVRQKKQMTFIRLKR